MDETGQPKILDFGVARVTDSDTQATRQTDLGQLLGTLAYMSPEQILADPLAVDIRSDVYALGVILYELLAGKLASFCPGGFRAVSSQTAWSTAKPVNSNACERSGTKLESTCLLLSRGCDRSVSFARKAKAYVRMEAE